MVGALGSQPQRATRPLAAKLTLAAVLVAFAALTVRVATLLDNPTDPFDDKLARADRFLYYRVAANEGPRFELTGSEAVVRLVTHAGVPRDAPYDPAREVEYGVRVELDRGAAGVWQREVFTRSRQSKDRRAAVYGGLWLDENTFDLDRKIEVTDDRTVVINLPPDVPAGARLKVTLVGDPAEGYVRAYTPIDRPDVDRHLRELEPLERQRLADSISYLPWDRLVVAADLAAMRYAERRLVADGKEGVDYRTQILYTTGFRIRYSTAIERGELVAADRAVAMTVVGPARVNVVIGAPLVTTSRRSATVNLELVGDGPAKPPIAIAVPASGDPITRPLDVPAGTYSATFSSDTPVTIAIEPAPDQAVALGGSPGVAPHPDEQFLPGYLSTVGAPPIEIAMEGPDDLLGRVLRVDVRLLATAPCLDTTGSIRRWVTGGQVETEPMLPPTQPNQPPGCQHSALPSGPLTGKLTLEAVDANGSVLTTISAPINSEPSRFEQVRLFGKLTAAVAEPVGIRLIVPVGARAVRVTTDRTAVISASTPIATSPPPDQLEPPYDSVVLVTTLWRYARYLERGWVPLRPRNADALMPDRTVVVAAQARLETKITPLAPDSGATSLVPAGRPEQQTVIERIAPEDAAQFIARWTEGHYTRLVPGAPVRLNLSSSPTRPIIQYRALADGVVGAALKITIDGETIEETFKTPEGTIRLPSGSSGSRIVKVETAARVRLLIDRPPIGGGELYALRTIYRLADKSARFVVTKRDSAPLNVNLVFYAAGAAPDPRSEIRIVVDGGSPARISGVALTKWTLADRTLPLPPADRAPTLGFVSSQGGVFDPRLLAIALGDDLPKGNHTIDVTIKGTPVWARFFTLQETTDQPRALQWRDATDRDGSDR